MLKLEIFVLLPTCLQSSSLELLYIKKDCHLNFPHYIKNKTENINK